MYKTWLGFMDYYWNVLICIKFTQNDLDKCVCVNINNYNLVETKVTSDMAQPPVLWIINIDMSITCTYHIFTYSL